MQVETSIDESDVGRIEEGQEATFTVDAFPNKVFSGKVKQVRKAPVNIQNVVTYTVLITADNPDLKLLPGMTANARIIVERKENTLKILNTALRFRMPATDKSVSANKSGKDKPNDKATEKPAWWKFWESKESSTDVAGAKKDASDRPAGGGAGWNPQRSSRFGSGQSNFRSVYVLEKEGNKETPVRKVFRLGLTDGEYSEILPLRDAKEAQLKVGDLVITGIEGQISATPGGAGTGANQRSGPRMF
jgi:HlyD family secretion protein